MFSLHSGILREQMREQSFEISHAKREHLRARKPFEWTAGRKERAQEIHKRAQPPQQSEKITRVKDVPHNDVLVKDSGRPP